MYSYFISLDCYLFASLLSLLSFSIKKVWFSECFAHMNIKITSKNRESISWEGSSSPFCPKHLPVNPPLFATTEGKVFYAVSSDIFIHSHLSSPKHIFNCSSELINFQQEQNFSSKLIENLNYFLLPLGCMPQNNSLISIWVKVEDMPVRGTKLISGLTGQHTT